MNRSYVPRRIIRQRRRAWIIDAMLIVGGVLCLFGTWWVLTAINPEDRVTDPVPVAMVEHR
jgi:hypothetical protein